MMTDAKARNVALELLEDVFVSILAFADQHGITVKDMAELLQVAQVRAMRREGKSQQEIMAASGFVLKTVRKLLNTNPPAQTSMIARFLGDWARDKDFPDVLPLSGGFPSFADVVLRYGGEFRPGALLKILKNQEIVEVKGAEVKRKTCIFLSKDTIERIRTSRHAIRQLIGTVQHNTNGSSEPFLERRIWSHQIPVSAIPAVRRDILNYYLEYREKAYEIITSYEDPVTVAVDSIRKNVGLGTYWFEENA